MTTYVKDLQPELVVNYCQLVVVSVDEQQTTAAYRKGLGAEWPFLSDADRRLLHELEMVDATDPKHGEIYIPYTFILARDRTIHRVYNGWWYVGRPTVEEVRTEWRKLMERRDDWVYSEA